ncbi:MAG: RICIN domain-containing protein [Oscillospiraceae bacterium]|nr:RICIN domain-containing protein [Oscillospiraceae bacterium]
MKIKKSCTVMTAIVMAAAMLPPAASQTASAAYGSGQNVAESLDRGISAVNTGSGMLVSWRFLADDSDRAEFQLYRDDTLIYTSEAGMATSYLDKGGNASSKYRVDTVVSGKVVGSDSCTMISNQSYFDIALDIPRGGTTPDGVAYTYEANDCSVGDVDGDGVYEIFLKWNPTNAKDNSQSGYTGNVYIDCYRLTGEKLWRIDLGRNIRAGAHYTQFLVADFDNDGKCEMTCKTADGTVDAKGKIVGDASKDYRNSGGYILSGPEYYSLFDGATGTLLDTVSYEYPRGNSLKSTWGDDYGNRCDRFLGCVAYLDGVHPSAVSFRGYYTRMTAVAYDVVNKKLVKRWAYDSGVAQTNYTGWGNGNHNCMPADVDGDGKDEILVGAVAFDDNGKVLWSTNLGHGDAMHLSDFLPDHPGQEFWVCHEHEPWGVSLIDAATGKILIHENRRKDTGRCCAGNVWAGNPGGEFWGSYSEAVFNGAGQSVAMDCPSMNFLIWWDGDLERELLDNVGITKINQAGKIVSLFEAAGCASCNGTKATPNLSADIFGDWREELILHTTDSKYLRIFCTPYETEYRITTLMHDMQYRMQVATEQNCYNQPPHPSFYLGSDQPLPDRPALTINGQLTGSNDPAVMDTTKAYHLRNANSQQCLSTSDGNAVQAPESMDANTIWHFVKTSDTGYQLVNAAGEILAVSADGSNVTVDPSSSKEAQEMVIWRTNGGFLIRPAALENEAFVEVGGASTDAGANVQTWERNGHKCQTWVLEAVAYYPAAPDFIPGDLDGNRVVNAADFSLLKQEILKPARSRVEKRPADLNGDAAVTIADAVAMQKYLLTGEIYAGGFYYAIDAGFSQGIEESTNAGFKDAAYVNLDNVSGSFIEFRVYAPKSGSYSCVLRTANGSTANRIMKVSVNGGAGQAVDFNGTGAWTTWEDTKLTLTLKPGMNTVRLTSDTDQGGPNIDYLAVTPA